MSFVIDASVAVSWAFADEASDVAAAARARLTTENATAPSLWWFEVRNVLIMNERRKRLEEAVTAEFLRLLELMPIQIDRFPEEGAILTLARRHRLTVYDAAYLELARRRGEPLATLDHALTAAARAESVALIGSP